MANTTTARVLWGDNHGGGRAIASTTITHATTRSRGTPQHVRVHTPRTATAAWQVRPSQCHRPANRTMAAPTANITGAASTALGGVAKAGRELGRHALKVRHTNEA